jgi:large subunit ribosomal protein L33
VAKSQPNRGYVWLQCTETGDLNYRVQKRIKGNPYKLELKKYSPRLKKHTLHKESKKK